MKHNVRIQKENRKSLAMKVMPKGVMVLIPRSFDPDSLRVHRFIEAGLREPPPPKPVALSERLTPEDLRGLVSTWSERIGVQTKRVQIRTMRNRWASCSTNGTLTLSSDLLSLPHALVDYVVCHELVHLKVPHHGKDFRALVGCYMPDWQQRERSLASWVAEKDSGMT